MKKKVKKCMKLNCIKKKQNIKRGCKMEIKFKNAEDLTKILIKSDLIEIVNKINSCGEIQKLFDAIEKEFGIPSVADVNDFLNIMKDCDDEWRTIYIETFLFEKLKGTYKDYGLAEMIKLLSYEDCYLKYLGENFYSIIDADNQENVGMCDVLADCSTIWRSCKEV